MKILKSLTAVLIVLAVSVLIGCSDQITSSGSGSASKISGKSTHETDMEDLYSGNSFTAKIRLKPHRSYTFDDVNTDLIKIDRLDVYDATQNPALDKATDFCRNLLITSNSKKAVQLSCHSTGIDATSITIQNLSGLFIDLDVTLVGKKKREIPKNEQ